MKSSLLLAGDPTTAFFLLSRLELEYLGFPRSSVEIGDWRLEFFFRSKLDIGERCCCWLVDNLILCRDLSRVSSPRDETGVVVSTTILVEGTTSGRFDTSSSSSSAKGMLSVMLGVERERFIISSLWDASSLWDDDTSTALLWNLRFVSNSESGGISFVTSSGGDIGCEKETWRERGRAFGEL